MAVPSTHLSQALRLFTILHLTVTRRAGTRLGREQLAQACSCSQKTIGRDISALQQVNIPIHYDQLEQTYTLPDKNWGFSLLTMHRTDALSLALLQGFLASDEAVLPFLTQLHTTLDKAAIGLSPGLRVLKDSLANALREVGGTARDYSHAPLQTLLLARANSKTVEMLYSSRSSDTTRFRKVDPYRIDRRDGRYLEMQAWCHERKEVRTFALDRVQEVRILEETFSFREWKQSDDGIVGGIRGGSPVDVHVRFDRVVAPFAKDRRWPFAATLTEETDGSIVLKGTVLGTEGMVRELLSWRRHALVLGGKELLKAMQEEVAALSDLYSEQRVDTLQEKK